MVVFYHFKYKIFLLLCVYTENAGFIPKKFPQVADCPILNLTRMWWINQWWTPAGEGALSPPQYFERQWSFVLKQWQNVLLSYENNRLALPPIFDQYVSTPAIKLQSR